jgi:hypothetical protein
MIESIPTAGYEQLYARGIAIGTIVGTFCGVFLTLFGMSLIGAKDQERPASTSTTSRPGRPAA